MTDYFYDMDLVVDPLNTSNVVANGLVSIYDPADTAGVTLLALKDPTGLPLPNPVHSNANGFLPPRIASLPQVMWKSGGFTGYFNSYKGLRDESVAAKTAAQSAADNAVAAASQVVTTAAVDGSGALVLTKASGATVNAGNVKGPKGDKGDKGTDGANVLPTDDAIKQAINDTASATRGALNATYASKSIEATVAGKLDATAALQVSTPKAMGRLLGGLASRATGPAPIAFTGSSTTDNYNASDAAHGYVALLGGMIQAAYPAPGGVETSVVKNTTADWPTTYSTAGVHLYNAGLAGTTSATYLDAGKISKIAALNPIAVIHMIGSNDYANGTAAATYKANVQAKIDAFKGINTTKPCVHILVQAYQRIDATYSVPWASYGQALKDIADADPDNVMFVDLNPYYAQVGIPGTDPLDLIDTDNIHQRDAGHSMMADTLRRLLGIPLVRFSTTTATGSTLVQDNYTRPDSATTPGLADTGQAYEQNSGVWGIRSNKLYLASGNGHLFFQVGTGDMDVQVQLKFDGPTITAGTSFGMQIHVQDTSNRIAFWMTADTGAWTAAKFVAGAQTNLANGTGLATATNTIHVFRVVSKGNKLTFYINGTQVATYTLTSAEFTQFKAYTKAGLRQSVVGDLNFDNLWVRAA